MWSTHRRELALGAALLVLLATPAFTGRGFYAASTFVGLIVDTLPVLVAAVGMTIVIVAAEIDISIAGQLAVCGVVGGVLARAGVPMPVVIPLTVACGAALGLANGLLVSRLAIPSIVATLAMWVILENGLLWITGGNWIQDLPPSFQWFGFGQTGGQVVFILIAGAVWGAFAWLMRATEFGRGFYAVGCNREAALRMRLHPERVVLTAFVILGALMGLASILYYCRYPSIETTGGRGLELKVIASVVVGGTSISGGRGTLLGTLLGVMLLGVIGTVLTFSHVDATWERAVQGLIILVAVVSDRLFARGGAVDE